MASLRHTYRVKHRGSDGRLPRETEFEAPDAATALLWVQAFAPSERPVVLMEDGRELATVQLALEGFWTVLESHTRSSEEAAQPERVPSEARPVGIGHGTKSRQFV